MDSIVHILMAAGYLMVTPLVSYKLGYRLSCSSGPSGPSNGEHQASKLLAQNSTAAEITQHKYSGLMAAGYLMVTPLVSYKLGQESYRLSSSSRPSGPSNGKHQASKLLAQNSTAAEITQHKYSGLMAAGYLMVTPIVSYKLGQESYRLSCSSGPSGPDNGEHQANKLLAQNSTAAEITQHKYSDLMAAGYLMVTPLVSYKLGQESYRLSCSSGPSGPDNGEHQASKLLAQNSTAAEITQHKYSDLMAAGYLMVTPLVSYKLGQESYRLSCSSGPSGPDNGEHQASKLLAQNSTAAEITQHKYSDLMAAIYAIAANLPYQQKK